MPAYWKYSPQIIGALAKEIARLEGCCGMLQKQNNDLVRENRELKSEFARSKLGIPMPLHPAEKGAEHVRV